MRCLRHLVLGIILLCVVSKWETTQARKFKSDGPIRSNERIKIDDPTAKANPNIAVESAPFDPLLLEMEEERDDREWEKRYMKLHHGKQFHGHVDDPLQHMAHAEGFDDDHNGDWESEEIEEEFAKYRNEDDDAQWDDHDAHEMLDEEDILPDHFNITERLHVLFPEVDADGDRLLSSEELVQWQLAQQQRVSVHRSARELEAVDTDGDGMVTLEEALQDEIAGQADEHGDPHNDKDRRLLTERFRAADESRDGKLDLNELNGFLHPEDSPNAKLRHTFIVEEIAHRDNDNDGRLSLEEFKEGLFPELMAMEQQSEFVRSKLEGSKGDLPADGRDPGKLSRWWSKMMEEGTEGADERFKELDKDKDGFLSEDEVVPLLKIVWPSEKDYIEEHVTEMMTAADTNKDGKLSLSEMEAHPHVFYNTIMDDEDLHDEF